MLAYSGMWLVTAVVATVWFGWSLQSMVMAAGTAALSTLLTLHSQVLLTSHGLGIRWIRRTVVPWSSVGAVYELRFLGEGYLSVLDAPADRSRRLPAPRTFYRIGRSELTERRQLIEQWRAAHRDLTPPPPPEG
jgi:hypothetical protein